MMSVSGKLTDAALTSMRTWPGPHGPTGQSSRYSRRRFVAERAAHHRSRHVPLGLAVHRDEVNGYRVSRRQRQAS